MENTKLLVIISIVAIGGLFFGYLVSVFTGYAGREVPVETVTVAPSVNEERIAFILRYIGLNPNTNTDVTVAPDDTILSRLDKTLGDCEYLGLQKLNTLVVKDDNRGILMSAKDACAKLGYTSCFAGEYSNIQTFVDSIGGTCIGRTQLIGKDLFLEECTMAPVLEICRTSTVDTVTEPYRGDIKDSRYLVAAICCGK